MAPTKIVRRFATVLAFSLATYAAVIRPRLLRWGATDEELKSVYPGAGLIAGGKRAPTLAITIDAPPSAVWRWLVQMGYDRAGYYSWDLLDNLGRHSADRIHPEWQSLAIGSRIKAMGVDGWEVAMLEPQRFLGLRPMPGYGADALWGVWLKELPGNRTRLIVSGYWTMRPSWLQPFVSFFFYEWTHWIMQTRQLANLKRRAERAWGSEQRHTFMPNVELSERNIQIEAS